MRKTLLTLSFIMLLSMTITAQPQTFSRDTLEYELDLPTTSWRAVPRVDVHQHFDFMNGNDSSEGYLRLTKRLTSPDTSAADLFRYDEKWELRRLPGYVVCSSGKGADFQGRLRGTVFSYEFASKGMNMDGRIYYLQLDNRTFYVLHFTVASEKLQDLRIQMDSIAQSFRLKSMRSGRRDRLP